MNSSLFYGIAVVIFDYAMVYGTWNYVLKAWFHLPNMHWVQALFIVVLFYWLVSKINYVKILFRENKRNTKPIITRNDSKEQSQDDGV